MPEIICPEPDVKEFNGLMARLAVPPDGIPTVGKVSDCVSEMVMEVAAKACGAVQHRKHKQIKGRKGSFISPF
jgi:hypothetical protein